MRDSRISISVVIAIGTELDTRCKTLKVLGGDGLRVGVGAGLEGRLAEGCGVGVGAVYLAGDDEESSVCCDGGGRGEG